MLSSCLSLVVWFLLKYLKRDFARYWMPGEVMKLACGTSFDTLEVNCQGPWAGTCWNLSAVQWKSDFQPQCELWIWPMVNLFLEKTDQRPLCVTFFKREEQLSPLFWPAGRPRRSSESRRPLSEAQRSREAHEAPGALGGPGGCSSGLLSC